MSQINPEVLGEVLDLNSFSETISVKPKSETNTKIKIFEMVGYFFAEFKDKKLEEEFCEKRIDLDLDYDQLRQSLAIILAFFLSNAIIYGPSVLLKTPMFFVALIIFLLTFKFKSQRALKILSYLTAFLFWAPTLIGSILVVASNGEIGPSIAIERIKNQEFPLMPFMVILFYPFMGKLIKIKWCFLCSFTLIIPFSILMFQYFDSQFAQLTMCTLIFGSLFTLSTRRNLEILERKEFLLTKKNEFLNKIFDADPEPNFLLSSEYLVTWANRAAESMLGMFKGDEAQLSFIQNYNLTNYLFSGEFLLSSRERFSFPTFIKSSKGNVYSALVKINKIMMEEFGEYVCSFSICNNDHDDRKMQIFVDENGKIEYASTFMILFLNMKWENLQGRYLPSFLEECGCVGKMEYEDQLRRNELIISTFRMRDKVFYSTFKWIKNDQNRRMYGFVKCMEIFNEEDKKMEIMEMK